MNISLFSSIILLLNSCQTPIQEKPNAESLNQHQKAYWYDGKGEVNSYQLEQARYGEMREGSAMLIFVTEDFSTNTMTKANDQKSKDLSILKTNHVRKFETGIYPYSMMTSTFFPFPDGKNAIKVTSSSQEWCGHTFVELVEDKKYEVLSHSYFQGENNIKKRLDKVLLEDEIWSIIRINPESLPEGKLSVLPSFMFLRLSHTEIKEHQCMATRSDESSEVKLYSLHYAELGRSLKIRYESAFPFRILGWEESYESGWGEKRKLLTTKATLIKSSRIPYWEMNSNANMANKEEIGVR